MAAPPLSVPVPSVVVPSMKVTVPLGPPAAVVPGAFTLTVAVKVTDCPDDDGLEEEETVMLVLAWLTVWEKAAEVLSAKLLSPP